jgi:hypothetical protein
VSDVVVMLAFPFESVATEPRLIVPAVKLTVPEGVEWPGPVTEAEKVTLSPAVMLLLETASEVDVLFPLPTATV